MTNLDLKGHVEVSIGGYKVASGSNLVQYEGFDALGKIVSGNLNSRINGLYLQFDSSGVGTPRTVDRTLTAASFRALVSPLDFLRIPIGTGILSALDSNYNSNVVIFNGIAPVGLTGHNGKPFNPGAKVEIFALAIMPDLNDATQDMVYAAFAPTTPVKALSASGVGIRWQIQFAA